MPFSNVVRMRIRSLVSQTKDHSHWSGSKTSAHVKSRVEYTGTALPVVVAKAYAVGRVLHLAAYL